MIMKGHLKNIENYNESINNNILWHFFRNFLKNKISLVLSLRINYYIKINYDAYDNIVLSLIVYS